ncbi:hypothetical protein EYR36_007145 [Pleurotus pulmonarius]|nr:hypothetical protein EYR36_007145 [Pleurotus pulmonarius]
MASSRSSSLNMLERRLSTSSISSLTEMITNVASSSSILLSEEPAEVVKEEELRHVPMKLDASMVWVHPYLSFPSLIALFVNIRRYKTPAFAEELLHLFRSLQAPSWTNPDITADKVQIRKVSGSLTNAVFFVSCPTVAHIRIMLLRIYGASSGALISRPKELQTLHILSSRYHFGPRVYGTFENGRLEEYFESTTLTADEMKDPTVSGWIAARMAELHSVDIELLEGTSLKNRGEGKGWEIGVKRNVQKWVDPARNVLALPNMPEDVRTKLDIERFCVEWQRYMQWLSAVEDLNGGSRRVFAHNDAQYGNLLRLAKPKEGLPGHRQIIVVDFEYASPNPAAFDIANHFHEWTANYHSSMPHILDPSKYPTAEERRNFYASYLQHSTFAGHPLITPPGAANEISKVENQVRAWSPASHGMWAVWGIVQAEEDLRNNVKEPEFDYLGYAMCRMGSFRKEIQDLGIGHSPV